MVKQCTQCSSNFEITDEDLKAYDKLSPTFDGKKFSIPTPKMCPLCRQQRRLSMRNERKLYTRKCDLSGRQILSIYSPDKPYKVYDQPEWWSDKWDPMIYGREYDFSRPFFEQFRELYLDVPRVSLHTISVENSYYTCYSLFVKNCYLLFGASNNEDCMFGKYITGAKNCLDSLCLYSCEFCYQGVASDACYGCRFFTNCRNCSDSTMIEDCNGCKNCICCFGLRSKEYCILNQFVGKEKYQEFVKDYEYLTHTNIEFLRKKLADLKANLPHVQSHIYASENCSGDAIFNSKNCHFSYDVKGSEDCKYIHNSPKSVCTYDGVYSGPDGLQFCYNACSTVGSNLIGTYFVWYCDSVHYSMDCLNSRDLFGCVGLRNKRYCIFNKQYTKEEYEKIVAKIIEQMQKEGIWGEFFPYELAPCDYNETVAMEYFPIKKEEALKLGARWHDEVIEKIEGEESVAPDDISKVDETILEKVLKCEVTGKRYKVLPQELKFYQRMKIPVPRRHPDQRHYDRLKLHDAHRLYERKCSKCSKNVQTVYLPESKNIVYCEECYLKEIY
ncbi:MAG: hypothetical protein NTZ25_04615 [Candidatus Peregrinibacteria bacterium]|nr:hypothetical protein [Candidatus Peregrinibacteria bacterium]